MNRPELPKKRITIEVEPDFHVKIKTKASSLGKTIKKAVTDILGKWVNK